VSGPTRRDAGDDYEYTRPVSADDPNAVTQRVVPPAYDAGYQETQQAAPLDTQPAARVETQQAGGNPAAPEVTETAQPKHAKRRREDVIRYGPGIPAQEDRKAQTAAEQVWRTGKVPGGYRRPGRLRRVLGTLLTVGLLAASGVVLFLRFHHASLHVSDVAITQQTPNGCGVNVTGRVATNGAAGTVSYQWVFRGDQHAPVPQNLSVISGQHDAFVTVSVQGSGHGTVAQQVTLQVLGPDTGSATATVKLSC